MIEARFQGALGAFRLDVSLSVPPQGVTVLFGPSGSGKTTLLRCLAGLARLEGRLSVNGAIWQGPGVFTPPHKRGVGYVFQDAALFEHLGVRGNLMYGRRRAGLGADAQFEQVADLLGLGALMERSPSRLSGGERQRVAIGRALLSDPRLMLMDEPLASLDAARKAEVIPYLEALRAQAQVPIFYVTHDVTEAARLGDRMLRMSEGKIVEAVELRATDHDNGERTWLERRYAEVGGEALAAEFVLSGASPAIAGLAVEAIRSGRRKEP